MSRSGIDLRFGRVELFPPNLNWDFMKWRWWWIALSGTLVAISLLIVAIKGINWSIDFTGGVEIGMTLKSGTSSREKVLAAAESTGIGSVEVTSISSIGKPAGSAFVIRVQHKGRNAPAEQTSADADKISSSLKSSFGAENLELSYANISGKVGKEEERRGYMSVLLSLVSILVYVALRFDSRFAPGAVLCLFHDVILALGFMTALGRPFSNTTIAAFLTIVGYSINDTIIIYDRIREISVLNPRLGMTDVINRSVNQTMSRTALTQVTVWMALGVMVVWGGGAIFDFALTMLIGTIVGSYSSIYVAAPLTIEIDNFLRKRGLKMGEARAKVAKDPNFIPPVVVRKREYKK